MERRFSTDEVVALTGMTPRQLQWWDERGIVCPAREGRRRLYSIDDIAAIAVIRELRLRGFSLQRIRQLMRALEREFGRRLVETVSAGSEYHLLTDGARLYLRTSPEQVVEVLKAARQPMFAICLSDTVRQLCSDVGAALAGRPVLNLAPSEIGSRAARKPAPQRARPPRRAAG